MWARRYPLLAATAAVTAGGVPTTSTDRCGLCRQRNEEDCRKCEYECFEFHNDLLRKMLHERTCAHRAFLIDAQSKAERKEGVCLDAEIVFEIEDHRLVTETSSKFTVRRGE